MTVHVRPDELTLVVRRASPEEAAEHQALLDRMQKDGQCLWRELGLDGR
ncbi:MAG: hypothetical protein U5K38_13285 [Woeseiaceae bacterium]|nr:hypothetical protein [Woeseiaceae bacterium]